MVKLLLIEDDKGLREQMKWALSDEYSILEVDNLESAVKVFSEESPHLVCLDMGLENIPERGLKIIDELILLNRAAKIIVITSNTSETLGTSAINRGAFDYLAKPVEIDELKILLHRACRIKQLEKPMEEKENKGLIFETDTLILGESDGMKTIFTHIERLSKTDVNVLITGDSGTGKEICARAIHFHSNRRSEAFIPLNCGAIPETLLESELFGYVKGAFTGAHADKVGLIEAAHKGTLFLDEIGDMPMTLQVKLLRILEDQKLQRLGDTKLRPLDVRIIAATNKATLSGANNDSMRSDLYFRLSEFEIHLPPLKDREKDVLLIAQKILNDNINRFNMPKLRISPRAETMLLNYSWPGNIRELENKLNRASITCENQTIEAEDLRLSETSFTTLTFKEARLMFEKKFITNALKQAKGNVSLAAKDAGISRPTFYDLIKKHGVKIFQAPTD